MRKCIRYKVKWKCGKHNCVDTELNCNKLHRKAVKETYRDNPTVSAKRDEKDGAAADGTRKWTRSRCHATYCAKYFTHTIRQSIIVPWRQQHNHSLTDEETELRLRNVPATELVTARDRFPTQDFRHPSYVSHDMLSLDAKKKSVCVCVCI